MGLEPLHARHRLRQRQAAGAIGGDDIGRQRDLLAVFGGRGRHAEGRGLGLDARGVRQHALGHLKLVALGPGGLAADEVMATRAMAMSAMTMQMTAQAFARESAAVEMPSLWARRPAPGTTEMEGASSKESSSARDEET